MASRRKKVVLWVLVAVPALGVLVAVSLAIWSAVSGSAFRARVSALQGAGEPVTIEDLIASWPEPPPDRNAAPLYEAALAEIDARKDGADDRGLPVVGPELLPKLDEPLSPKALEGARRYLAHYAKALRLLHEAAARDGLRFDATHYRSNVPPVSRLASMRHAARVLALEAVERAESGKGDEAGESLRALFRLAHAFRREPWLINAMVVVAIDAIGLEHVERWLVRGRPSPDALRRVEDALRAEADPKRIEAALVGERCNAIGSAQAALVGAGVFETIWVAGDWLNCLAILDAYVAASRRPVPANLLEGARLGASAERSAPFYHTMSRMFAGVLGRFWREEQRVIARLEAARAALAALRLKASRGRLPEKLQDLVPDFLDAVPPDPFDGKPLRYRKDGESFVVYSVSENGKDDGGDIAYDAAIGKWPDIGFGFRWLKPPK